MKTEKPAKKMKKKGKKHQIQFEIESSFSPLELEQKLKKALKSLGAVEAFAINPAREHSHASALSADLGAGQAEEIFRSLMTISEPVHLPEFLDDLNALAHKIGSENPLQAEILKWRSKIPKNEKHPEKYWDLAKKTAAENEEMRQFAEKIEKAQKLRTQNQAILEQMQAFLVPLPHGNEYESLSLAQQMVKSHFNLKSIIQDPSQVEGVIWNAFLDFKRQYIDRYLSEFEAYQTQVNQMHEHRESLQRKVRALEVLDEIHELGRPSAGQIGKELESFFAEHLFDDFDLAQVRKTLSSEPFYKKFVLGQKPPNEDFRLLEKQITKHLERKLQKIQSSTISKVVQTEQGSEVQKLLDLLSLSNLNEIVRLLSTDQSSEIVAAIRKILA